MTQEPPRESWEGKQSQDCEQCTTQLTPKPRKDKEKKRGDEAASVLAISGSSLWTCSHSGQNRHVFPGPAKRGWRDIVERLRKGSEQLFCVPREPKDHGMALDAPDSQV